MAKKAKQTQAVTGDDKLSVSRTASHRIGGEGVFEVYKSGQGYYTRLVTAIVVGALVLWGAHWIFTQFAGYRQIDNAPIVQAIPFIAGVVWLVGLGYLAFYLIGRMPKLVDFFIASEGEMKKVHWSTRREVFGATKVVIIFAFMMGLLFAVVDFIFQSFFYILGVLKVPPAGFLEKLFGG